MGPGVCRAGALGRQPRFDGGAGRRRGRRSCFGHESVICGAVDVLLEIEKPKMELIQERQGRCSCMGISCEQGFESFGRTLEDRMCLCSRRRGRTCHFGRNGSGEVCTKRAMKRQTHFFKSAMFLSEGRESRLIGGSSERVGHFVERRRSPFCHVDGVRRRNDGLKRLESGKVTLGPF